MKNFKTMEWIRNIRDKQYEETKNMSKDEIIAFHRNRSKQLDSELNIKKLHKV